MDVAEEETEGLFSAVVAGEVAEHEAKGGEALEGGGADDGGPTTNNDTFFEVEGDVPAERAGHSATLIDGRRRILVLGSLACALGENNMSCPLLRVL